MQPVRSEVDKGKGRRRAIYLAVAWSLVIGLFWLFQSSATDREGRSQVAFAVSKAREAQLAIGAYYNERKSWPTDLRLLLPEPRDPLPFRTAFRDGALVLTFADSQRALGGKTLVFEPRLVGGKLEWTCDRGTVESRYRQQPCRKPD